MADLFRSEASDSLPEICIFCNKIVGNTFIKQQMKSTQMTDKLWRNSEVTLLSSETEREDL